MRPRLIIPPTLHVVAVALSACGNTAAPPADVVPTDVAADRADAMTDTPAEAASDACVLPDSDPFGPQPGFACARALDAGAAVRCPDRRVCTMAECGGGCEACQSTLFCIPDTLPDGGRPDGCAQNVTCDPDACGAGCRAVG
jgi:hypothetical protein